MSKPSVESLLKSLGPTRSSKIVGRLMEVGLSPVAARQRVSRTRGAVRRLKGILLPNKERFLYLGDQFNTERFWQGLLRALDETNSCYGFAAHSLIARRQVPLGHFAVISGAPTRLRGHVPASRILKELSAIQLCCVTDDLVQVLPCFPNVESRKASATVLFRVEQILLNAVEDWLKRMGFVSFNKVRIRDEKSAPEFSHFKWDLVGPSYLSAFVNRKTDGKPKPGFVVADVCLAGELSREQVGYFLQKCSVIRNMRNMRPFHAFLVADSFQKDALIRGRENGLVFATPDDFFGHGIRTAFRSLLTTLAKAAAVSAANPEVLADLLGKLGRIEGAAGNLRGALFELIVAHSVKQKEAGNIDVGREVRASGSGELVEIDVLHWKPRIEVLAIECKGHGSSSVVEADEIQDWLNRKIPRIRGWLSTQEDLRGVKTRFEFWTSGSFDSKAARLLQAMTKARKFTVGWKMGHEVAAYISDIRSTRLKNVFKEHYTKHPLSKLD